MQNPPRWPLLFLQIKQELWKGRPSLCQSHSRLSRHEFTIMGIILVGANHRSAAVGVREQLAFTDSACVSALRKWMDADAVKEALILSTCNRVELLAITSDEAAQHETDRLVGLLSESNSVSKSELSKHIYSYLTDDEYLGLQSYLLKYPEAGKVVPRSGGVRKLRWAMAGKGKSGGVRVIYYFKKQDDEIWLLTIYSKSEIENIPAHVLRQIAKEIENA